MATQLGVINRALARVGEPPLLATDIATPVRKTAIAALEFYDATIREMIRAAPWTCAIKRAELNPETKEEITLVVTHAAAHAGHIAVTIDSVGYPVNLPGGSETVDEVAALIRTALGTALTDWTVAAVVTGAEETVVITQVYPAVVVGTHSFTDTDTTDVTATVTVTATGEIPEQLSGYEFMYALPSDLITLLKVLEDPEYIVEGRYLYTDSETITMVYTYQVEESEWDDAFSQGIELRLASKIANTITAKVDLGQLLLQESMGMAEDARRVSLFESKTRKKGGVQFWTDIN